MKKCYKAPEIEVVDLDLESVCQSVSGGGEAPEGAETEAAQYRESYRSSLWND